MNERTRIFGRNRNDGCGWVIHKPDGAEITSISGDRLLDKLTPEQIKTCHDGGVINLEGGICVAYFPPN